jgi:hypothetical protein
LTSFHTHEHAITLTHTNTSTPTHIEADLFLFQQKFIDFLFEEKLKFSFLMMEKMLSFRSSKKKSSNWLDKLEGEVKKSQKKNSSFHQRKRHQSEKGAFNFVWSAPKGEWKGEKLSMKTILGTVFRKSKFLWEFFEMESYWKLVLRENNLVGMILKVVFWWFNDVLLIYSSIRNSSKTTAIMLSVCGNNVNQCGFITKSYYSNNEVNLQQHWSRLAATMK